MSNAAPAASVARAMAFAFALLAVLFVQLPHGAHAAAAVCKSAHQSALNSFYADSTSQARATLVVDAFPTVAAVDTPAVWTRADGWSTGADCCTYFGITCDAFGNVTGIQVWAK